MARKLCVIEFKTKSKGQNRIKLYIVSPQSCVLYFTCTEKYCVIIVYKCEVYF